MRLDHVTLADIFRQPAQLGRVAVGLPAVEVGRRLGQMARALVFSQLAAERFRAQEAFVGR